jgi:hypothetical protein
MQLGKVALVLASCLVACGPKVDLDSAGDSSGGSSTPGETGTADDASSSTLPGTTASPTTVLPTGTTGDGTGPVPATTGSTDTGSLDSTTAACAPVVLLSCSGTIYECGDGDDNDGDGLVDLADPECVSPCNDDESSFYGGFLPKPGDCTLDCWFDGNSGPGDDMCEWNLRCDPLEPGGPGGYCEYSPGPACEEPVADDTCLELCVPLTPNGRDCWGCCTLDDGNEVRNVHLWNSDCSLSNPEACLECTQHMEACGNPCEPEACEVCFGETEPPPGCAAAGCVDAQPCADHCECEPGGYCLQGCCHPAPPK